MRVTRTSKRPRVARDEARKLNYCKQSGRSWWVFNENGSRGAGMAELLNVIEEMKLKIALLRR
jgi:hypothetical protein